MSKTFCALPWLHVFTDTNGDFKPCCVSTLRIPSKECDTPAEVLQTQNLESLRRDLGEGKQVASCSNCWKKEELGHASERQKANDRFRHLVSPNNTSQPLPLSFDIRLSNLCNMRCRTCWHGASSSWYKETIALGGKPTQAHIRWDKNPLIFFQSMPQWEPFQKPEFMFAGGEPFMEPLHPQILEIIHVKTNGNCSLKYISNVSNFHPNLELILKLLEPFKEVTILLSIDHIGIGNEWLRKGGEWKSIEKHLRVLSKQPNIKLIWHPTVSALNVRWIPRLHRYLVRRGFIQTDDIELNLLDRPREFHILGLHPGLAKLAKRNWVHHLTYLNATQAQPTSKEAFEKLIPIIGREYCPRLNEKLKLQLERIDFLRKEDSSYFLPLT